MHFYMHSYLHKIFILVKSGCYTTHLGVEEAEKLVSINFYGYLYHLLYSYPC
jgi:hypothetical protein